MLAFWLHSCITHWHHELCLLSVSLHSRWRWKMGVQSHRWALDPPIQRASPLDSSSSCPWALKPRNTLWAPADISIIDESFACRVSSQIKHDVLCTLREDLGDRRVPQFAQGLRLLQLIGGVYQLPRYRISEVSTSESANNYRIKFCWSCNVLDDDASGNVPTSFRSQRSLQVNALSVCSFWDIFYMVVWVNVIPSRFIQEILTSTMVRIPSNPPIAAFSGVPKTGIASTKGVKAVPKTLV